MLSSSIQDFADAVDKFLRNDAHAMLVAATAAARAKAGGLLIVTLPLGNQRPVVDVDFQSERAPLAVGRLLPAAIFGIPHQATSPENVRRSR